MNLEDYGFIPMQEQTRGTSYERPYLEIPMPDYSDPRYQEYVREQQRKQQELASENTGSVIIIDI